ncbi:sensor histidine kinase [Compostibacter hankyongensis]|uniref:Signal transduction histidine kinase internal region domain-containing protein n=1 Tax=Compostibacter hankyongensis TaxID=1007089 RepID=A0ABP8FTL6_9BACT
MENTLPYSPASAHPPPTKRARTAKTIGLHALVWTLYFFYENGIVMLVDPSSITWGSTLLFFPLNILVFYGNTYFILARTVPKRRYVELAFFTLLLAAVYLFAYALLGSYMRSQKIETFYPIYKESSFVLIRIFRMCYFLTLSYAYWFATYTIKKERQIRKLEEIRSEEVKQRDKLEKDMLRSELDHLRYQINPHFLFNTLSFIYTQVYNCSSDAARSVLLLSDIMRYALDNKTRDGKVPVIKEIQHIRSLIEINQLRFGNRLQIFFEVKDEQLLQYRRIVPLVLITFVENAFKHGDLQDTRQPLVMKIALKDERLYFFSRNKKKIPPAPGTGTNIGLENVKKRMALIYGPEGFHLQLDNDPETPFYQVELTINV